MSDQLPNPIISPDGAPHWAAAREDRLVLQTCSDCNTPRFIPRHLCQECGSDRHDWRDASGSGVIHSLTTVHRGPTAAFRANTPYVVALIDLAEGPRMMTNIVGANADQAKIGDKVTVCFEERQDGAKIPQFQLVEG